MLAPTPLRVALTYIILSALWIVSSDSAVGVLFSDSPTMLVWASTFKGWFFVLVTGGLLYLALAKIKSQAEDQGRAVAEAQSQLATLIASAPVGIFRSTLEGRFLFVNPALARLHGFDTPEELLHSVRDIAQDLYLDPKDRNLLVTNLLARGSVTDLETRRRRADGRIIWANTSANLITDPLTGQPVIHGFTFDVTVRKQAEEDLRRQEGRFRKLIEASPIAIAILNLQTGVPLINPAFTLLLGYLPEDLPDLDSWWRQAYPDPAGRATAMASWTAAVSIENEASVPVREYDVCAKDGTFRTLEFHTSRIDDTVVVMLVDLTERLRASAALRRSEAKFRSVIECSPNPLNLYILDIDGVLRFIGANPAAERITGPACNLMGLSPAEAFPGLDGTNMPELLHKVARGDLPPQNMEFHYQDTRFSGTFELNIFKTEPDMLVVMFTDISERIRMRELLVQTEKMVSVAGLAAGVAHEINNPLAGILHSVQNIARRLEPDLPGNLKAAAEVDCDLAAMRRYLLKREILNFLAAIKTSGERAAAIVQNMLGFTRKSASYHSSVDLAALMDGSVEIAGTDYDLKKRFDFRKIEIVREYDPHMPTVPCSPQEIQQVIYNLLFNAAQALAEAKPEKPRIVLRVRREGPDAVLEVEDNGAGMDETVQRKAFEPFYTTKNVGEGTGLGLSVSYYIVTDNHRGSIAVRSAPGQGATFTIRLPLKGSTDAQPNR